MKQPAAQKEQDVQEDTSEKNIRTMHGTCLLSCPDMNDIEWFCLYYT